MNESAFTFVTVKSLLIWLYTNVIAVICYWIFVLVDFHDLDLLSSLERIGVITLVGLVFSFPANLLLMPALYLLNMFRRKWYRLAFSIAIVLFMCWMVILIFTQYFNISSRERTDMIVFLLPYIVGAEISFILVGRKMIFGDLTGNTNAPTHHSEKI